MKKCFWLFYSTILTILPLVSNAQKKYSYELNFGFSSFEKNQKNSVITHLFSTFDKYLFEYILEEKQEILINAELDTLHSELKFDTLGVYIIDLSQKKCIQIDSFSKNFKIIGNVSDQNNSFALKLHSSFTPSKNKNDYQYLIVDTVLENQTYKIISDTAKGKSGIDSAISKIFFVRKEHLLTPWGVNNSISQLTNYTLAGFSIYFIEQKMTMTCIIQAIKLLGKREEEISKSICEKLIQNKILD